MLGLGTRGDESWEAVGTSGTQAGGAEASMACGELRRDQRPARDQRRSSRGDARVGIWNLFARDKPWFRPALALELELAPELALEPEVEPALALALALALVLWLELYSDSNQHLNIEPAPGLTLALALDEPRHCTDPNLHLRLNQHSRSHSSSSSHGPESGRAPPVPVQVPLTDNVRPPAGPGSRLTTHDSQLQIRNSRLSHHWHGRRRLPTTSPTPSWGVFAHVRMINPTSRSRSRTMTALWLFRCATCATVLVS